VREQVEAAVTAALASRIRPLLALVAAERAEVQTRAAELAKREAEATARERWLLLREAEAGGGAGGNASGGAAGVAAGGGVRWAAGGGSSEVFLSDSGSEREDGLLPIETRCSEVTEGGGCDAPEVEAFIYTYSSTTGQLTNERLAPAARTPPGPSRFGGLSRLGIGAGGGAVRGGRGSGSGSRLVYAARAAAYSGGGSGGGRTGGSGNGASSGGSGGASGAGSSVAAPLRRITSPAATGLARWRRITSGSGRILKRSSNSSGRPRRAAAVTLPGFHPQQGTGIAASASTLVRSFSDPLQQFPVQSGHSLAGAAAEELLQQAHPGFCYGRTCDVLARQQAQQRRSAAWR
jgi:hypothetical protein